MTELTWSLSAYPSLLEGFGSLLIARSLLGCGVVAMVFFVDRLLRRRLSPNARFLLFLAVLVSFVVPPLWQVVLPETAPGDSIVDSTTVLPAVDADAGAFAASPNPEFLKSSVGMPRSSNLLGRIRALLPFGYLVGVLLAGGLFLRRLLVTRRMIRRAERGPGPDVLWAAVAGPCVVGLLRPRILLPHAFASFPRRRLDMVLRHERLHIKRADLWTRLVQNLIHVVFWFHPAVWWLNRRIDDLREMAVDTALLRHGSVRRADYCTLLVELAGRKPSPGLAMAGSPRIKERLAACLKPARNRHRWPWVLFAAALPFAVVLLPSCTSAPKSIPTTGTPSAAKSLMSPFQLTNPPSLPEVPGADTLAPDSGTQIMIQSWLIEVPTASLKTLSAVDVASLSSLPDADVLSAPSVITLPNLLASIEVGREVVPSPTSAVQFAGVRLDLLPKLAPGFSASTPRDQARTQPVHLRTRTVLSEPATAEELRSKGLPPNHVAVAYRSVDKTVAVADGELVELGRLHKIHEVQVEDVLPVLGQIPIIGTPFRRSSIEYKPRTIVILAKPTLQAIE